MYRIQPNGVIECDAPEEALALQRAATKRPAEPEPAQRNGRSSLAKRRAVTRVHKGNQIRMYLRANPAATPGDVVLALARSGVCVSSNYVHTVKAQLTKAKAKTAKKNTKPTAGA